MDLAGEGKKEEYAKPHRNGRGVSYWKIGLTTVAVTQDLFSWLPFVLYVLNNSSAFGAAYYLNQDNQVNNYPNSYSENNFILYFISAGNNLNYYFH